MNTDACKVIKGYTNILVNKNKQQYKATIESAMVSTREGIIKNSPMDVGTLVNLKNTSAINMLSLSP